VAQDTEPKNCVFVVGANDGIVKADHDVPFHSANPCQKAMQNVAVAHDTPWSKTSGVEPDEVQADPFQIEKLPVLSAMQKVELTHEIRPVGSVMPPCPTEVIPETGGDQLEPFQVMALPSASLATQKVVVAHETDNDPWERTTKFCATGRGVLHAAPWADTAGAVSTAASPVELARTAAATRARRFPRIIWSSGVP
jgi:hypothetical protein